MNIEQSSEHWDSITIVIASVIVLPLCPLSLAYKKPQRHRIIHGMQRTIDWFEDFLKECPVQVISVALFEDVCLF